MASTGHDIAWVTVDPAVLDGYAGFYRRREYGVTRVWRDGQRLLTDAPVAGGGDALELHPASETEFYPTNGAGCYQYTFLRDPDGLVSALLMRVQGIEHTSPRVDAAGAELLMTKLSERIRGQKPLPGSDTALVRLVEGIRAGNPPYEEMATQLAQTLRLQLPLLQPLAEDFGAFRSLEFRGVGNDGWDVYGVQRERGASQWRILLSKDGKIVSANLDWDRPGHSQESGPRPANSLPRGERVSAPGGSGEALATEV